MENIFTIILIAHAVAGTIALIAGSINMIRKKGTGTHIRIGLIYFYAVIINACCAFFLSVYHLNLFLFSLGVISFYFVVTGRVYLIKSRPGANMAVWPIQWVMNSALFCFGVLLTAFSLYKLYQGDRIFIPLTFGLFFTYLSVRLLYKSIKSAPTTSSLFLKAHIGSMIGSYITILSAFLVVNNHGYFPVLIGWFGPTVLFVPLMRKWQKEY